MENPERVLYGRLEGYGLSVLGQRMAQAAADEIAASGRPVSALFASPLQRTQESAAPIALALDLTPRLDERFIEPANDFEGMRMTGPDGALRRPRNWVKLRNPLKPSWGEPFASIAARMMAGIADADASVDGGDVVIVSHQLPIWMVHLSLAGERLFHDPRKRRCALSSITSFEREGGVWREVSYRAPAAELLAASTDLGAV